MTNQTTISKQVIISGIALHSGKNISIKILPAKAGTGIIFKRVDIETDNVILANYENVTFTTLCTKLSNSNGVSVATIEHLMAAIYALGIDNLLIEVDGPEIPILDGSAATFVTQLKKVGIKTLESPKSYLYILKEVGVDHHGSSLTIKPSKEFIINCEIEFDHPAIMSQTYSYKHSEAGFVRFISRARTFGLVEDLERLHSNGLALGANYDNVIALDNNGLSKRSKLRYYNEFVKHKVLDMCGDLFLSGFQIKGEIFAYRPGHLCNNLLLKEIFSDPSNYIISNDYPTSYLYNKSINYNYLRA